MSEPMMEKVDAERAETDFLRRARGEGGEAMEPVGLAERRVERKHSSHWA
jgi:hypothetical protein